MKGLLLTLLSVIVLVYMGFLGYYFVNMSIRLNNDSHYEKVFMEIFWDGNMYGNE
jgi:hypothetical protein